MAVWSFDWRETYNTCWATPSGENFLNVVNKAKTACEVSGHSIDNHFPDVRKMVDIGSGTQRVMARKKLSQTEKDLSNVLY